MQSAYTFYILGLNFILSGFSDNTVTALGLYYKWQTFFFIPLGALQTCIVPILSYNYAARSSVRIRSTLRISLVWGMALMAFGTLCFECIPRIMLSAFTLNQAVLSIGTTGFRIIGIGFLPMVTSLIFPVFSSRQPAGGKCPVNRYPHHAFLCSARLSLFPVWPLLLLVDLSCHRTDHQLCRLCLLSPVLPQISPGCFGIIFLFRLFSGDFCAII